MYKKHIETVKIFENLIMFWIITGNEQEKSPNNKSVICCCHPIITIPLYVKERFIRNELKMLMPQNWYIF